MNIDLKIIAFSGGKESLLTLHKAVEKYEVDNIHLSFVDYSQPALDEELTALYYYAEKYSIKKSNIHILKFPVYFDLSDRSKDPDIPYRNSIIALHLANYFEVKFPENTFTLLFGFYRTYDRKDFSFVFLTYINSLLYFYDRATEVDSLLKDIDENEADIILESLDISRLHICMYSEKSFCGECYKCSSLKDYFPKVYNKLNADKTSTI